METPATTTNANDAAITGRRIHANQLRGCCAVSSRNRARTDLLPAFEGLHGGAIEAVSRMAVQASDDDRLLDALALTALAGRRSADGWIDWRPAPLSAIAARMVRAAVGAPAPSSERTEALVAAANDGRGGRVIELGSGRNAVLRGGRVRIVQSA